MSGFFDFVDRLISQEVREEEKEDPTYNSDSESSGSEANEDLEYDSQAVSRETELRGNESLASQRSKSLCSKVDSETSEPDSSDVDESDSEDYSVCSEANEASDTASQAEDACDSDDFSDYEVCGVDEPKKTYTWTEWKVEKPYQEDFRHNVFSRDQGCVVSNAHLDECEACHIKPAQYCAHDEKCEVYYFSSGIAHTRIS